MTGNFAKISHNFLFKALILPKNVWFSISLLLFYALIGYTVRYKILIFPDSILPKNSSWELIHPFKAPQFFVNYVEFGFARRALIGTAFYPIPEQYTILAASLFSIISILLLCTICSCASRRILVKGTTLQNVAVVWFVLLNPILFMQMGFDFARFDFFLLLVLMGVLYGVFHSKWFLVLVFTPIGYLTHAAFLFYGAPLILACILYFLYNESRSRVDDIWAVCRDVKVKYVIVIIIFGITYVAAAYMLKQHGGIENWKNIEKYSVVMENASGLVVWSRETIDFRDRWSGLLVGMIIWLLLYANLWNLYRINKKRIDILFFAPVGVLPLFIMGVDFPRWCFLTLCISGMVVFIHWESGAFSLWFANLSITRIFVVYGMLVAAGPIGVTAYFPVWTSDVPALVEKVMEFAGANRL